MSAHARIQAAAAARRALVEVFTHLARTDLAEAAQSAPVLFEGESAIVRCILLRIAGVPVNGAPAVFASVSSYCDFGKKPRAAAIEVHMDAQEGFQKVPWDADWLNFSRFDTPAGASDHAPRNLAKALAAAV